MYDGRGGAVACDCVVDSSASIMSCTACSLGIICIAGACGCGVGVLSISSAASARLARLKCAVASVRSGPINLA